MFERIPVEGGEESEKQETPLGVVDLKILYDDDVYGARIVAVEHHFVSKIWLRVAHFFGELGLNLSISPLM